MKIVLWSTSYLKGFGGAERIVHDLARRLCSAGDQVAVVADRSGVEGARANRYFGELPPTVEVIGARLANPLIQPWPKRPWYLLRYLLGSLEIATRLRRLRPDVVHLHLVNVDVLLLVLLRRALGFRLVLTLTGGEPRMAASGPLSRFKMRVALRNADAVTCVSSDLERWVEALGARGVERIPNGVDVAELRGAADRRATTEDRGGAAATASGAARSDTFVFCGRLAAVKRLDLLIAAFHESVGRGSSLLRLVVVGDGEEGEALDAQVRRLGIEERVDRRGALAHDDAMAVLATSRALVLSSSSEACPLVVLEAMALGRAVVAPDVGGVRDLVADGETGLLFPSGCRGSLAEHLFALASTPTLADELGKRGASRVLEQFNLTRIVERYRRVYRSVVGLVE